MNNTEDLSTALVLIEDDDAKDNNNNNKVQPAVSGRRKRRETDATAAAAGCLMPKQRTIIITLHPGSCWELNMPAMSDEMFKETFVIERHFFRDIMQKLSIVAMRASYSRTCIPFYTRLVLALYTLVSSPDYEIIGRLFGVSNAAVCNILAEFCMEVWTTVAPRWIPYSYQVNAVERIRRMQIQAMALPRNARSCGL